MAAEEIILWRGAQANRDVASLGVIYAMLGTGGSPIVRLVVMDGTERRYTLFADDTFPMGDQTWKLDGLEPGTGFDWHVRLVRVE